VRYGDHIEGGGADVVAEACRRGLEGVVSKRAGDSYAGRRTTSWQKTKCGRRQEFVVGGYTEPAGSRTGLGALLLGTYDGGRLRYAGRVGSGIDDETLARLAATLGPRERADPPFADPPRGASARGVHWVTPDVVAEVAFAGWTADDRLRQPVFKGLREDKAAGAVLRETPAGRDGGSRLGGDGGSGGSRGSRPGGGSRGSRPGGGSRARGSASGAAGDGEAEVRGVRISHPDRPVFAEAGLTKLDVVRYYDAVAELMVPYLARRPLTVIRCPNGVSADCFFQKHATPSVPRSVARVSVKGAGGETTVYPVVDTPEMLLAMVQNGVVEFHVWGSQSAAIERPDVLVFDLDPAPDVPWPRVREAARALRAELARRDLRSFVKTSGGKGLHVVVPVRPGPGWPRAAAWAREVVEALVEREPHKYTATMAKAQRGGKVFIDHFRNGRGATAAAPYSLRARPGAPVAVPIGWDGLTRTRGGADWTLERVLRRVRARQPDPWAGFWQTGAGQELPVSPCPSPSRP
jgi:bifunctional non-homologous end joining protein LigD